MGKYITPIKVVARKSCLNCKQWMPFKEKCREARTKDIDGYCEHWEISDKCRIAQEGIEKQLKDQQQRSYEKEWYYGNNRRLECL